MGNRLLAMDSPKEGTGSPKEDMATHLRVSQTSLRSLNLLLRLPRTRSLQWWIMLGGPQGESQ